MLNCEDIKNVLSPACVRLVWRKQRKASGIFEAEDEEWTLSIMTEKNYRHHVYREYIEFTCIHGLLGKRYRKVIPSFVVWYFESVWPGPNDDDKS